MKWGEEILKAGDGLHQAGVQGRLSTRSRDRLLAQQNGSGGWGGRDDSSAQSHAVAQHRPKVPVLDRRSTWLVAVTAEGLVTGCQQNVEGLARSNLGPSGLTLDFIPIIKGRLCCI